MERLLLALLTCMVMVAPVLGLEVTIGEKNRNNVDSLDSLDIDSLIKDLEANDSSVRQNAAQALGKINDTRAIEPLIQALKDNDSTIRWTAAWALGRMNDTRAVEPLSQVLNDNDSKVRSYASWALREMGNITTLNDSESIVEGDARGEVNDTQAVESTVTQTLSDKVENILSAIKKAMTDL